MKFLSAPARFLTLLTMISFTTLTLIGCVAAPPAPAPIASTSDWSPAEETSHQDSNALLSEWNSCQHDQMIKVSQTSLPAPEVVNTAYNNCKSEREAWVSSQIGPGMDQSFVESTATGAEDCSFSMWLGFVEHLRVASTMTDAENAAWLQAFENQPAPPCASGGGESP
jgi:hypothetical protein